MSNNVQVLNKITAKAAVEAAGSDPTSAEMIVAGVVSGMTQEESDKGGFVRFLGSFQAHVKKGKGRLTLEAPECILPGRVERVIQSRYLNKSGSDPASFLVRLFTALDESSPTGYGWRHELLDEEVPPAAIPEGLTFRS